MFGATECALRACTSGQALRSSKPCNVAGGGADVVGRWESSVIRLDLPRELDLEISVKSPALGSAPTASASGAGLGPLNIWSCAVLYESQLHALAACHP